MDETTDDWMRNGEFSYDLHLSGEEELIQVCLASAGGGEGREFVFLDVGANRGDWTGYLLDRAEEMGMGAAVSGHLFEVSGPMVGRLRARFSREGRGRIVVNNTALSDVGGEVVFRRHPFAEGVNTLNVDSDFWQGKIESRVEAGVAVRGDDYCAERGICHVDLLKIDTEGWEWKVIAGFSQMLEEQRIDVVQFEYGYLTADLHVVMKDFWRLFEGWGYLVGPQTKEGVDFRGFTYADNDFVTGANFVAALPAVVGR